MDLKTVYVYLPTHLRWAYNYYRERSVQVKSYTKLSGLV